jgi:hypothetical protein
MTKEQSIQMLRALQEKEDKAAHEKADTILCDFLTALGYADVVAEYDKVLTNSMTKEQAIQMLRALQEKEDKAAHEKADTILCDFLTALGYADVVAEYDKA